MSEVTTLPNGINIYSSAALEKLKDASEIAKTIMAELLENAQEGNSTMELELLAQSLIEKNGCAPLFSEHPGYPYCTCMSNNKHIVHGLASKEKLQNGDILSIDLGLRYKGYCSDHARTICIGGDYHNDHKDLINVGKEAFDLAVQHAYPGSTTGTLGFYVTKASMAYHNEPGNWRSGSKFKIFTDFQGHGIGLDLHEKPALPNLGILKKGLKLLEGMCICIEPVIIFSSSSVN